MSLAENRAMPVRRRSRGVRLIIVTAAILFAVLALSKVLAAVYALASFAIVAAAVLLALRAGDDDDRLAQPVAVAVRADDPLRAVVAGLPGSAAGVFAYLETIGLSARAVRRVIVTILLGNPE